MKLSAIESTPALVTTPKIINQDSPGLRLTPDEAANEPDELAIAANGMETDETREEAALCERDVCKTRVNRKEDHKMEINPEKCTVGDSSDPGVQ